MTIWQFLLYVAASVLAVWSLGSLLASQKRKLEQTPDTKLGHQLKKRQTVA